MPALRGFPSLNHSEYLVLFSSDLHSYDNQPVSSGERTLVLVAPKAPANHGSPLPYTATDATQAPTHSDIQPIQTLNSPSWKLCDWCDDVLRTLPFLHVTTHWILIILDYSGEFVHLWVHFQIPDIASASSKHSLRALLTFLGMYLSLGVFVKLMIACRTIYQSVFLPHTTQGVTSGSRLTSTRMGMRSRSGPC